MKTFSALLLLLAACSRDESPIAHVSRERGGNLKGTIVVPEFTFLEARDRSLSNKDLLGKVWTCGFVFTSCPTHCVAMAKELGALQKQIAAPDFRMVFVSVDPARDTPERMRWFLKNWQADPDRWYFLTGERSDIVEFANSGIKLGVDPKEPLAHSYYLALIDRKGVVRDMYDIYAPDRMKQLRSDIKTLLGQP